MLLFDYVSSVGVRRKLLVNGDFDCPELYAGENCTLLWYEILAPESTIMTWLFKIIFGILLVCMLYLIYYQIQQQKKVSQHNEFSRRGHRLRLKTIVSGALACFSMMVYYGFDANLRYTMDDPRGEVCMLALLWSNAFFIQSLQYLVVMYVAAMNNKLRKKTFLELIPLNWLEQLAVPWPLHIFNIVMFTLLAIDWHHLWAHPIEVIRLSYGVMCFYLVVDVIIFPYYFIKLARLLDEVNSQNIRSGPNSQARASSGGTDATGFTSKSRQSNGSVSTTLYKPTAEQQAWRNLATNSRRLAYMVFFGGILMIGFINYEVDQENLTHPVEFLVFEFIFATADVIYFIFYIHLLKPHGFLRTSTSSQRTNQDQLRSGTDRHGSSPTQPYGSSFEQESNTQATIVLSMDRISNDPKEAML